jgi:hypothetical protein
MKIKILFLALILISAKAFSQSKNNISVVYGITANSVDIHNVIGDFGYNDRSGYEVGMNYFYSLSHSFALGTGLVYSENKIQLTTIGPAAAVYNQTIAMVTVPVYARYSFLKYLYAQGGLVADHQLNYSRNSDIRDQSGVGIELGIGGRYSFGAGSVFVNPFYCLHGINASMNLIDAGVRFGIGYHF